ncbi:energy-coupling factor transporter transmembrane component T family protein [Rhodobium gokarnense]|uniref:Biotin transport system permease protein n=1 Tax=Rhodobium gokarnense TaxID=364296 RepID=A0ABT3HA04_9HYPH|nr:energy-coupling factor transporter transmembrane protein EcfT [Rhodobium gokarnense]MCW2307154.1 biotin transport system permease protein [Rhodobium gokarnense]
MIAAPEHGRDSGRPRSPLHRLAPGVKLLALAVSGTGLVLIGDWRVMAAALAPVLLLYLVAGYGPREMLRQLRPLMWLFVILFVAQGLMESWALGALIVLRIAILVLMAALITLTTPTEVLIETIERMLSPFRRFGVNPAKVGLAFSLALRFIPVISDQARQIREAQAARGLGRNPIALALPLIIRTLKMAADVADAIEARSLYDGDDPPDDRVRARVVSTETRKQCLTASAPETSSISPSSRP